MSDRTGGAPGPEPPDRSPCKWCGAPGPCAITFEIPGKPAGKPAGRAVSFGGKARVVAGVRQRDLEARIRDGFYRAVGPLWGAGDALPGPLRLRIVAVRELPAGQARKRDPVPATWNTGKPDYDNICKAVGDALNGVAWPDDSAIVDGRCVTLTGPQGAPARTIVCIAAAPPPYQGAAPSWVTDVSGGSPAAWDRGSPAFDDE